MLHTACLTSSHDLNAFTSAIRTSAYQEAYDQCTARWLTSFQGSCLAAKRATLEDKKALIKKVDAFIFDCDGRLMLREVAIARLLWAGNWVMEQAQATPIAIRLACLNLICSWEAYPANCKSEWSHFFIEGVIWRGDSLIEGVPETLAFLRSLVSNDVMRTLIFELHVKSYHIIYHWSDKADAQWGILCTGKEACFCDQQLNKISRWLPEEVHWARPECICGEKSHLLCI